MKPTYKTLQNKTFAVEKWPSSHRSNLVRRKQNSSRYINACHQRRKNSKVHRHDSVKYVMKHF